MNHRKKKKYEEASLNTSAHREAGRSCDCVVIELEIDFDIH